MEETEDFGKEDFGLHADPGRPLGPVRLREPRSDAPPLREVLGAIPAEVAARRLTTSTACAWSSGATT